MVPAEDSPDTSEDTHAKAGPGSMERGGLRKRFVSRPQSFICETARLYSAVMSSVYCGSTVISAVSA